METLPEECLLDLVQELFTKIFPSLNIPRAKKFLRYNFILILNYQIVSNVFLMIGHNGILINGLEAHTLILKLVALKMI